MLAAVDSRPFYRKPRVMVPLAAIVLAVGIAAWTVDHSPRFGQCMHEHKTDAAYRQMYEGGPVVSRLVRLRLQADCLGRWVAR